MEIIAIGNQKGGVGKTTTTVNLATAMALKGYRVALLDIDSQGNATSGLGLNKNEFELTINDVFSGAATIQEVLVSTEIENLFIAPSNINLIAAETQKRVSCETEAEPGGQFILKSALANLADYFDYVFLDCPPSLGFLTFNALVAASQIIVTLQCEYYALEGISSLVETIDFVKANLNPKLELGGILPTMYDGRTNLSRQVCENVRDFFKDKVFKTVIPRNIRISESPSFGKPIIIYDPNSAGALAYLAACDELEERTLKARKLEAKLNKKIGNF
jgi:chromosome partitioning protein